MPDANLARWSSVIDLPLVPVSMANLPDGKVLFWSAEDRFSFSSNVSQTYTVVFDPATGTSAERLVTETLHDMFCPGTANLPDGRIFVNGGKSNRTTSIFDPLSGAWTKSANMNIARAYQGTAPLADGSVFTLGGSWSGGVGNKHGEVWTEAGGWRRLPGVLIDPFLSFDPTRDFGMDSHLWLLPAGNGRVLHAGPGMNMNWIDTSGDGQVTLIGRRGDDEFSINGNAVMYDFGKVLKIGGAAGYEGIASNTNAYVIDIGTSVNVRKLPPPAYPRAFHNSVVLPNGQVVVIGGATIARGFTDDNAILAPEIFDPVTETFTLLPPMSVARNYHSIALLLPDGRVLSAGGGLCGAGCAANHANLQVLSPPYLFNADGTPATRPVIASAPATASHGTSITVTTNSPVTSFAMLRSSSTTHALNNDQRRLPLSFHETAPNTYAVDIPSNPGWALPGLYMLFAMNAGGTPSVAATIRIGSPAPLQLAPVRDQSSAVGSQALLTLQAGSPTPATLTYAAQGLPAGLTLDPTSGVIAGTLSAVGRQLVDVSVSDGTRTTSTQFVWVVTEAGTTRFVMLQEDSEVNARAWGSAAEVNVLDENGQALSRGAWTVSADSVELTGENGAAANAIDGNPATFWHTQWSSANPPPPHWLKIDLGGAFHPSGLRYLPRQSTSVNGTIARYRVLLSADGVNWGAPVAVGDFSQLGPVKSEKTIYFDNAALGKAAVQSSTFGGADAGRAVDGNHDGVLANGSVSHTNSDTNAWWEVDLGAAHDLFAVRLWNRADCCADRLTNFYVLSSQTPMQGRALAELLADPSVTKALTSGTMPATLLVDLPVRARYVRVQLAGTNFLQLAEVEVHGRPVANRGPTLAQPAPPDLTVGAFATFVLAASDPDGDALTYSATGLPPGLAVDPATGVISGTPTAAGTYAVEATVSDGRGGAASVPFNWFVGVPPAVVIGPISAPISSSGSSVTYTASAAGGGSLEYQWNFGDGTGDSGFTTSPTAAHTFTAPGVYTVTLTVRAADGSATTRRFYQAISGPPAVGTPLASSNLTLERRAGQSARIWVVNIDNDSVSVFDTASNVKVAEIAVGVQPRSVAVAPDGSLWVANKGSNTLSVIDPVTLGVVKTVSLPRASQPFGVIVAADGSVFVALEASSQVVKTNANGVLLATLDVGPNPRHLALTPTGDRLLVSRFVTRPQPGEGTATVQTTIGGVKQGGEVLFVNPSSLSLIGTVTLQHSDKPDTTVSGRGVPNYLGAPAISPDNRSAWVPSKQDNILRGRLRDGLDLDFQNTVRAISSRIDLASPIEDYPARVDHDNSSLASAAVYHPSGVYLFVALETSRQIAVLDAHGKRELLRVDAGRAPQAVAVAADGRTLYVHNALDRAASIYDLSPLVDRGEGTLPIVATLGSVAVEKLSTQVLRGKQLFYDARDPRLSRDSYMSCATCHNDGDQDGRTWDLTGVGEGLRNTIRLRGRSGSQGRLHWSANFDEVQDFEGQIRGLTQGTGLMSDADFTFGTRSHPLGDPKAGLSADLDALAAYVGSLSTFAPSPYRSPSGALTSSALAGRTVFANQCLSCHGGAAFTDSASLALHDVGTIKPSSGSRLGGPLTGLDTPTLRDVWATAPYLHDGSATTVEAAIQAHANLALTTADVMDVAAFVRQIGAEEPAVSLPGGTGLTALYFANATLTGAAALTRIEAVNFDWGGGAAAPTLPADNFSARWTGQLSAPSTGSYVLQTVSDDGVRLWVNGTLVIDNWTDHAPTANNSAPIALVAGQLYDIKLEFYERGGGAVAKLNWQLPGAPAFVPVPAAQLYPTGPGLLGQYFSNRTLTGSPSLARYEAVNFNWGSGVPASGLPADNFSVRWTGKIMIPTNGSYTFQTNSDDGVRLWVNGALVIDNWTDHAPTRNNSPAISLLAGQKYDIQLEYYERGGGAVAQLNWITPESGTLAAVPQKHLYGN